MISLQIFGSPEFFFCGSRACNARRPRPHGHPGVARQAGCIRAIASGAHNLLAVRISPPPHPGILTNSRSKPAQVERWRPGARWADIQGTRRGDLVRPLAGDAWAMAVINRSDDARALSFDWAQEHVEDAQNNFGRIYKRRSIGCVICSNELPQGPQRSR